MSKIKLSENPQADLELLAYEGQPKQNKNYVSGYESKLSNLPILDPTNDSFRADLAYTKEVLVGITLDLKKDSWVDEILPDGGFRRSIIAVENPHKSDGTIKEGMEILVAQWGAGFSSPIHGHASGFLHEDLLYGKLVVNSFRKISHDTVRPVKSEIFRGNKSDMVNIVSDYRVEESKHPRPVLVHNFDIIEPTATLHYVAEHTRDGRDNGFKVEHFDEKHDISNDVTRLTAREAMYSQVGDVLLVRSQNVPMYGDHYIVVTGAPVMKEHGLRPQDVSIKIPHSKVLDEYEMMGGLIILKLNESSKHEFYKFHEISVENNQIIFPKF